MTDTQKVEPSVVWVRMLGAQPVSCDSCGRDIPLGQMYVHLVRGASDERPNENLCLKCFRPREADGML